MLDLSVECLYCGSQWFNLNRERLSKGVEMPQDLISLDNEGALSIEDMEALEAVESENL